MRRPLQLSAALKSPLSRLSIPVPSSHRSALRISIFHFTSLGTLSMLWARHCHVPQYRNGYYGVLAAELGLCVGRICSC